MRLNIQPMIFCAHFQQPVIFERSNLGDCWILKLCTHILCLCSDILIVWGIFSLIMSRFVRSFSVTCYIWALKFSKPQILSAQIQRPVIFVHKIHGIPANRTTPIFCALKFWRPLNFERTKSATRCFRKGTWYLFYLFTNRLKFNVEVKFREDCGQMIILIRIW